MAPGKSTAAARRAWIVFEDESGQSLRPPKARTWAPRGHTPKVIIAGRGAGRVSMTGLVCYQPDQRSRLIYRMHVYHGRRRERKGFTDSDYVQTLASAHQQLKAPIVVVWDNLNTHNTPTVRDFVAAHDWITVFYLPPYAPEINPTEGLWSTIKRSLGNFTTRTIDQLAATVKHLLKRVQYRPELINGYLAETGLDLVITPAPP